MRSFIQPRFTAQGFFIFFFLVRHFRSSTFRRDCFRRTCALFQFFVAVEFHRGMRHFHLSLCSFVDMLRT